MNKEIIEKIKKYQRIALVLQGGGALGAYQAGVIKAMSESGIYPNWIAGISIGAFNSAIFAGNEPQNRIPKLMSFWSSICHEKNLLDLFVTPLADCFPNSEQYKRYAGWADAMQTLTFGQQGFFTPRTTLYLDDPASVSIYRTDQLADTLSKHVNFDILNDGKIKVSVGAVNVANGKLVYFDNHTARLGVEHIMASGALPPGFPPIKIGNDYFWDGGLVSNTPLSKVLENDSKKDTLIFQIDLWNSNGKVPKHFADMECRKKGIIYSSRNRAILDTLIIKHNSHMALKRCFDVMSPKQRRDAGMPATMTKPTLTNIVNLTYVDESHEGFYKDFEFSQSSMQEHVKSGVYDMKLALSNKDWFEMPLEANGLKVNHANK